MRYLIGIDAAKAKNDIAIFNSDMGLVRKPFTVSQSQSDIQKLAKSFTAIDEGCPCCCQKHRPFTIFLSLNSFLRKESLSVLSILS